MAVSEETRKRYFELFEKEPGARMKEETALAKIAEVEKQQSEAPPKIEEVEKKDDIKIIDSETHESLDDFKGPKQEVPKRKDVEPQSTPRAEIEPAPLKQGNTYLVEFRGRWRYLTDAQIQVGMKTHPDSFVFPEGTPYQVPARAKKCTSC